MSRRKKDAPAGDVASIFSNSIQQVMKFQTDLLREAATQVAKGAEQWSQQLKSNAYMFDRWVEVGVAPAMKALSTMERDMTGLLFQTLRGEREVSDYVTELGGRIRSGGRYGGLVTSLGKELFGSARFEGEKVLAENEYMTLSYLPPVEVEGVSPTPLFHAGGFLPYSDRIFRCLPEANLFDPFLRRGVPVYAVELKGDKDRLPGIGPVDLAWIVEALDGFADKAFEHNGRRKMALEGYCALGMPAMAYVAALPEQADRKFVRAATMVSPVDGRECKLIGKMTEMTPDQAHMANMTLVELFGNVVPGDALRMGMDIPIGAVFPKTPFGQFIAGWKNKAYADVRTVDDLNPAQRRELAGAYWISPENCRQYPMPAKLVQMSHELWTKGVGEDLEIPCDYNGKRLSFKTIVEKTSIQLLGFYGGKDPLIPEATGHVLRDHLGARYTHVVHPKAGHISYVLSPEIWNPESPYALDPNPVDLLAGLD